MRSAPMLAVRILTTFLAGGLLLAPLACGMSSTVADGDVIFFRTSA